MTAGQPSFTIVSAGILFEYPDLSILSPAGRKVLLASPLGTLVVASRLKELGVQVSLVDLDRLVLEDAQGGNKGRSAVEHWDTLFSLFISEILKKPSRFIGFSTICSTYPLTLLLATEVKKRLPGSTIVLGGPQASAVAEATLRRWPAVDCVLRGEVEDSLEYFLKYVGTEPGRVPGLVYRDTLGGVCSNRCGPPPEMSKVPRPAYELWLSSREQEARLQLETGRGCPFRCRFCSTGPFFGHRFRFRTVETVIEEVAGFAERYSVEEVILTHDHAAFDAAVFRELCTKWSSNKKVAHIPFSLSLRADSASHETLDLIANSNIRSIFIGFETGSQKMQRVIGKNIDIEHAKTVVVSLIQAKKRVTVSFITGYPEETLDDLEATYQTVLWLGTWPGVTTHVGFLAPLPGSDYERTWRDRLEFRSATGTCGQRPFFSVQAIEEVVASQPDVFPQEYTVPMLHLDVDEVSESARFVRYFHERARPELQCGVALAGGVMALFYRWVAYMESLGVSRPARAEVYYASSAACSDFRRFLAEDLNIHRASSPGWAAALADMLELERDMEAALKTEDAVDVTGEIQPEAAITIELTSSTILGPSPVLLRSRRSAAGLALCFRDNSQPPVATPVPTFMISGSPDSYGSGFRELPMAASAVLSLFSGSEPLNSVLGSFASFSNRPEVLQGWSSDHLLTAVVALVQQGHLVISAP